MHCKVMRRHHILARRTKIVGPRSSGRSRTDSPREPHNTVTFIRLYYTCIANTAGRWQTTASSSGRIANDSWRIAKDAWR